MALVKSKTSEDSFHDEEEDIVCNDAVDCYAKGWCPQRKNLLFWILSFLYIHFHQRCIKEHS